MSMSKIVYLSGNMSEEDNYKKHFELAEQFLFQMGYIVVNPANLDKVSNDLTKEKCLQVRYKLIDISDEIFMVSGWKKSKLSNAELQYAKSLGKKVMYQDYYAPFRKVSENETRNSD